MVMQVFHGDDGENFQDGPQAPLGRQEPNSCGSGRRWFVDSGGSSNEEKGGEASDQVASPYFLKFATRKPLIDFSTPKPA